MCKQKKLLRSIIKSFEKISLEKISSGNVRRFCSNYIRYYYKKSLNKKDLTRRILFDALLSDDDILKLLRIIFDKEK